MSVYQVISFYAARDAARIPKFRYLLVADDGRPQGTSTASIHLFGKRSGPMIDEPDGVPPVRAVPGGPRAALEVAHEMLRSLHSGLSWEDTEPMEVRPPS